MSPPSIVNARERKYRKLSMEQSELAKYCDELSATDLKNRFPSEYNSWRNMKQRQKAAGLSVHPTFEKFMDFLLDLGPVPSPNHTLDRIDPSDPDYAPEKVRWAEKRSQSNNRTNTVFIEHDGSTYSASELARQSGSPVSTIRGRIRKGWSFDEVINGRSASGSASSSGRHNKRFHNRAQSHASMLQQDRWPWLGPEAAMDWEDDFCYVQPSTSRFAYFEGTVSFELEKLEARIDLLFPAWVASEASDLSEEDFEALVEHFPKVTRSTLSSANMKNLRKLRKAKRDVLEKLEAYREKSGEYHYRPDWDNETE